jgi:predicted ATPase
MIKENYFILTGAMGAGKSVILETLRQKYFCVDEPARIILKQQRAINGDGVPEINSEKFNNLMREQMIADYNENAERNDIVIFDRGIPDIIGYAELLGISKKNHFLPQKNTDTIKMLFCLKSGKKFILMMKKEKRILKRQVTSDFL